MTIENSTVETEIDNGIGRTIAKEPNSLDEYEYNLGDAFVRWAPWGDERAGDDIWKVTNISWQFETTWITDRDNPTTFADHRIYHLMSKETMDEVEVPESELRRGGWRLADEVDDVEV